MDSSLGMNYIDFEENSFHCDYGYSTTRRVCISIMVYAHYNNYPLHKILYSSDHDTCTHLLNASSFSLDQSSRVKSNYRSVFAVDVGAPLLAIGAS